MRAVTWCGVHDMRVQEVDDPRILNPRDAIVRITRTAICGSDLHLYNGFIPAMQRGDIVGHEFMGEVVETGSGVSNLQPGDRVVVPFTISCGRCWYCEQQLWSLCDNSNPNAWMLEDTYGHSPAGLFGYSHLLGGYAGGQAEFARVPFADVGPLKVPDGVEDEQALSLTDIFPTGYQAAEQCNIRRGDVIAVWGCGPVGQFAIRSAFMLGAERVIAIDHYGDRLMMAADGGAETLDFSREAVYDRLMESTGRRGPDACIDAVGLEAHGTAADALYDFAKVGSGTATDRIHVLRQMIRCCRKGGTLSIPGVHGGIADKVPVGAMFNKGLAVRCGQTHVQRYIRPLAERIERGEIDPSFVITHRFGLEEAPHAYEIFRKKQDHCIKCVLTP
jgi:threonine dehydrogenase-like Zn-dependent dehydrogenase